MKIKEAGTGDLSVDISANRTPIFFSTAQAVSSYINSLPLTSEQNNRLVELMIANVQEAERSGFYAGCLYTAGGAREGTGNVFS